VHYLPATAVLTPFVFALLLGFCRHWREKSWQAGAFLGVLLTFALSLTMLAFLEGDLVTTRQSYLTFPLTFSFRADSLSVSLAVLFSFCYLLATIYSFGYLAHSHARRRYFVLLLLTEGALLGVLMSASLMGLFLFFELLAVLSYLLIIHEEDSNAMLAGAKYLYMTIGAGLAIFYGLVVTYYLAGRTDFIAGGYISASPLAASGLFAFLLGFGIKAGMFPLHIWLPDAYSAAPAPVSAILSGCLAKMGAYGLIRVIYDVYGLEAVLAASFDTVLLCLAVATIFFGSALALQQDELKRRLAYSSVAQIGYVLLGVALLSERALFGALFHIFSHALMKGTLFLCAGAIITQTGKKNISELAGLGRQMPLVMGAFTLAALSMVGLPLFNAFISKWNLALASLEGGLPLLVGVLIISSLLNALYYFPIVISAFFASPAPQDPAPAVGSLPAAMLWTTVLMALLCVNFAFLQPYWPGLLAGRIAAALF